MYIKYIKIKKLINNLDKMNDNQYKFKVDKLMNLEFTCILAFIKRLKVKVSHQQPLEPRMELFGNLNNLD